MDPQTAAMLAAIMPLVEGLVALGVPGLILGMAAIPAIVITLICWLNYRHYKQMDKTLDAYRADTQKLMSEFSNMHEECIRVFTARHEEVVNFYNSNVALVKNHERLNDSHQTLIVNNTRVMERLCVVVESLKKQ